ncbi:MAG: hypothetical protein EXR79_05480 [Myxococcales bacterium]|nr:hypothetical protein [Myxococcales bacterium]
MATLTSSNLRGRLVLQPRGYQFQKADNLYDLNWLWVLARLWVPGAQGRVFRTRLATWEIDSVVSHCLMLAHGQRAMWHPRFFDSGLHLWVRRSNERADLCVVTALLSQITGPLPADGLHLWHGDRYVDPEGLIEGVRFQCTRAALAVFAEELRNATVPFPVRTLQKTA